jgi:hypothetical protein
VDPARPRGLFVQVDLGGNGDFDFVFSGEVSRVVIRVAGILVHDGPPIEKLSARPGLLRVEMDARGDIRFRAETKCEKAVSGVD